MRDQMLQKETLMLYCPLCLASPFSVTTGEYSLELLTSPGNTSPLNFGNARSNFCQVRSQTGLPPKLGCTRRPCEVITNKTFFNDSGTASSYKISISYRYGITTTSFCPDPTKRIKISSISPQTVNTTFPFDVESSSISRFKQCKKILHSSPCA